MERSHETNLFYAKTPLNLGHRGASHDAPENTLPAFRLAADMGADGVELDAQLSKDGHVIVVHDYQLDATTNGRGPVNQKTLAELKTLDAGSHFSAQFAGTPIPTLQEVLVQLGPVLLFNIELKTVSLKDEGLEAEVIRLIEDHGLQDRAIVSSFNPFSLLRARRVNPRIKRGLLWAAQLPFYLRWQLFRPLAAPDMFHPPWETVTPAMVAREHSRGAPVNVWTCNDAPVMRRLIEMGVDSIMTDRPDRLKQVLNEFATA